MSHSFISHATQKSFSNAKMSCNYAKFISAEAGF